MNRNRREPVSIDFKDLPARPNLAFLADDLPELEDAAKLLQQREEIAALVEEVPPDAHRRD